MEYNGSSANTLSIKYRKRNRNHFSDSRAETIGRNSPKIHSPISVAKNLNVISGICLKCGIMFVHKTDYNQHNEYVCEECGEAFVDPLALQGHSSEHDVAAIFRSLLTSNEPRAGPSMPQRSFSSFLDESQLPDSPEIKCRKVAPLKLNLMGIKQMKGLKKKIDVKEVKQQKKKIQSSDEKTLGKTLAKAFVRNPTQRKLPPVECPIAHGLKSPASISFPINSPIEVKLPPKDDKVGLPPKEDTIKLLHKDKVGLPPKEDNAKLSPKDDKVRLPPKEANAKLLHKDKVRLPPKEDTIKLLQKEYKAELPPKEDNSKLPPKEDKVGLPPKEDNAKLPPINRRLKNQTTGISITDASNSSSPKKIVEIESKSTERKKIAISKKIAGKNCEKSEAKTSISCEFCEKKFESPWQIAVHLCDDHGMKFEKIKLKRRQIEPNMELSEETIRTARCPLCCKNFGKSYKNCLIHIVTFHRNSIFHCEINQEILIEMFLKGSDDSDGPTISMRVRRPLKSE